MSSFGVLGQLMFDYTINYRNNESLTNLAQKGRPGGLIIPGLPQ